MADVVADAQDAVAYKICGADDWRAAGRDGVLPWSNDDRRDGYVHLSTAAHVRETARLHYAGRDDLWLLAVDVARLGDALRWETSRGGVAFPHLYADLTVHAVVHAAALPRDDAGGLQWPAWCP
jgi:uncharacterized protein (DUF952 family)